MIKPQIVGDLAGANVAYESPYGRIASNWKLEARNLKLDVTIPINATATVYVPAKDAGGVTESGTPAAKAAGVKFLRMENGAAVYAVGSGTYRFESPDCSTQGKATRNKTHEFMTGVDDASVIRRKWATLVM